MSLSKIERARLGAVLAVTAAAAAAGFASSAQAVQPLTPPPSAAEPLLSLYQDGAVLRTGTVTGQSQSGGFESATVIGLPEPVVFSSASGFEDNMISGGIARLGYYFKVVGADSDTPIELAVTGSLEVRTSSHDGSAKASISAGGISHTLELYDAGDLTWSGSWLMTLLPNRESYVFMGANTGGNDYDGLGYDSYAYADPIISFVGAHEGYSLAFSDGIGNTAPPTGSGAPEPAAWALMLMGFGGLGAALRRRQRSPAVA